MAETKSSLRELAHIFLRLGFSSFGGPAVHIANMNDEFVKRRRWLTSEEFLDLLGATNMIPGPNSTEMAIHIGYSRARIPGLIVAGVCFIVPAALIVLAIAVGYVRFGTLPQLERMLYAIKPVVIAIIAFAVADLGRTATKTRFLAALGIARRSYCLGSPSWLCCLAPESCRSRGDGPANSAVSRAVVPLDISLLSKNRLRAFGTGYVLVAFLQADLVEKRASDSTPVNRCDRGRPDPPGPLFTTATFIGYLLALVLAARSWARSESFCPHLSCRDHASLCTPAAQESSGTGDGGINVAAVAIAAVVVWRLARRFRGQFLNHYWNRGRGHSLAIRSASAWVVLGAALIGLISDLFV
jgi:chromate transporter